MTEDKKSISKGNSWLQVVSMYRSGWIVFAVCVLVNLARCGVLYTFGLYISELRQIYGASMTELNWISVISVFSIFAFSPVTTSIIQRYPEKGYFLTGLVGTFLQTFACLSSSFVDNIHWLFLTFGILFGVGSSLLMMSTTLIVGEFFPATHRYHIFATSMYQCACPAGILIFTTLHAWIIKNYSWRWCLRFSALKLFVIGIISSCLLLLEKPNHEGLTKSTTEKNCCRYFLEIFKKLERICWVVGIMLLFAVKMVSFNILPHYMIENGYDKITSSSSLVVVSATDLFIYIVSPFFGHLLRGKLICVNIISTFATTILYFLWPQANNLLANYVLLSALGLFSGMVFVLIYPTSGEAMDMNTEVSWTITCTFLGLGALLEPLITGLVYDFTSSYATVFYVVALFSFISSLILATIPLVKYVKQRNYEELK